MNETLKSILSRRSIRNYKREQIRDEEVQAILDAGKFAPSAVNQQSWHFTVIQSEEMLRKLTQFGRAAFLKSDNKIFAERAKAEDFCFFYNAPTFIIVSCDEKSIAPQNDGSLALGNMFIAAHSLGIGSCWIHAMNFFFSTAEGKKLKKELGVPEGYIAVGSGAFGYMKEKAPDPAPRKENTVNFIK